MSPVRMGLGPFRIDFPRVSGDEPSVIPGGDFAYVFSPRERG